MEAEEREIKLTEVKIWKDSNRGEKKKCGEHGFKNMEQ